jgi:hypothetical protein
MAERLIDLANRDLRRRTNLTTIFECAALAQVNRTFLQQL